MKDRAYAKINLALDVFNERSDGYHDLKSIMIPINFYDELEINKAETESFSCNKYYIEYNEKNSIYKMLNLFREKYNIKDNFEIKLNKSIPTQAGLGGGTADAASTLRIMKKMYDIYLSREEERQLCVACGADVYMNFINKPSVVEGIGDKITPFKMAKQYSVLLVKPKTGVSTKESYQTLDMSVCDHPNVDKLKQALESGESIKGLLGNSLEQPALILNKDVKVIKEKLLNLGCENVLMSGSGSTVFAISENRNEIASVYNTIKKDKYFIRYTKTLNSLV